MTTLANFLDALYEDGRVQVGRPGDIAQADRLEAARKLVAIEALVRNDAPGEPPNYDAAAALWAAEMLHRACQLAVYREFGAANVEAAFSTPCPVAAPASAHYSVDLTFRYLPDLHRLTRHAAPGDPLVAQIAVWAAAWPLSSVGIAEVKVLDEPLIVVLSHTSLRQQYVDRIFARRAADRLDHPATREAATAALGLHHSLAGDLSKKLQPPAKQGSSV
jgi:hypothetical protein